MGQINLIAYAFLLGGFLNQRKKYSVFLITVAIILKPILLFLLLFFLLKKSWRILIGVTFLLFLITICTMVFYPKEMHYYIVLTVPSLLDLTGREVYYNQGIMGFIARLIPNLFLRGIYSLVLEIVTIIIGLIAVVKIKNNLLGFSIFLNILVIVDSLSWQHHFIFLILPWIVGIYFITIKKINQLWFSPIFLSYFLVSLNISHPEIFLRFPYILLLSHTFYGAIILLVTLLSFTFLYKE